MVNFVQEEVGIMNNRYLSWFKYFVVLDCLLKWLAMYTGIRNGVISVIAILFFYCICLVGGRLTLKIDKKDTLIIMYMCYNVLLLLVACIKGYSFELLFSEICNTFVPMFAYWIGKNMERKQAVQYENAVILVAIVLLVSGVYYNYTLSDKYYLQFLETAYPSFHISWFSRSPRLTSFYGSVICGVFGCFTALLSFRHLVDKERKNIWRFLGTYLLGCVLAILTLQRSAMLCVALFSFVMLILLCVEKQIRSRFFIGIIFFVVVGALICGFVFSDVFEIVVKRVGEFGNAIGERVGAWGAAFDNGALSTVFGYGFATGGQRAIGISKTTVNDGNYFKIIYELGLLGLFLFILLIASVLKKGYREKKIIYMIFVCSSLTQMIGSNILTFYSTATLFWYVVGRIMHKENGDNREKCTE